MQANEVADWMIVGAGPAGIAAVGKLLDAGIAAEKIYWIDPVFKVGDFGGKWRGVSSNTKVKLFTRYLNTCHSFEYDKCQENFLLNQTNPEETCELELAADPLLWVTKGLRAKVKSIEGSVEKLSMKKGSWQAILRDEKVLHAKNVILAIGSEAKSLSHSVPMIDLETALNPEKLKQVCQANDTVAVFGSSHSAVIIMQNLLATSVKKIINFYLSPFRYAVYLDNDEILFDDTGLKGKTAQWARENLHGALPERLVRVIANQENLQAYLPECTKAVYAVGFARRENLAVEGVSLDSYNDRSGILAPGLFGVGIAFPQASTDRFGNVEYRVGLWKFIRYLGEVLPVWLKYGI